MRAFHLDHTGSIEGLNFRESADPAVGDFDVMVALRAAAINRRDLSVLYGTYVHDIRAGLIPLSDAAGEVIAVGSAVSSFRVGDRVVPNILQRWLTGEKLPAYSGSGLGGSWDGVLRDRAIFGEQGLIKLPHHLSFEEGAALGLPALTAWAALTAGKPLLPGDTVLVQGSGNISLIALQLAKLFGARVVAATSRSEKAGLLGDLGADLVTDCQSSDGWLAGILEFTGGTGLDRVIEVIGPSTLPLSISALASNGHLSLVGSLGGKGTIDPMALMRNTSVVQGIVGGSRDQFAAALAAIDAARLRPVVGRRFAFDEAPQAYAHATAPDISGRTLITID